MSYTRLQTINHMAETISAIFIATFWTSTVLTEAFLSPQAVASLKSGILLAFLIFVPCMIVAGATGMKIISISLNPLLSAKRKRIPLIGLNGLIILLPCAFYLSHLANTGSFDETFHAVQLLELVAGALNLTMLCLNIRDGRRAQQR